MFRVIFTALFGLLIINACSSSKLVNNNSLGSNAKLFRVAFYNVENLFDTIDVPHYADEEFTPFGKKKWNTDRFNHKLDDLSKVIQSIDFPNIIGMCEVENANVLNSLFSHPRLKSYDYNFIHFDSPDFRGIDVALAYRGSQLKILEKRPIKVDIPDEIEKDYTTRDILLVVAQINTLKTYIFVNHWPSRRGGLKTSEPKRMYVASVLENEILNILKQEKKANFIIMGDFNDEPSNQSLMAITKLNKKLNLVNTTLQLKQKDKGTYNYKGNWNMLDQIIISNSFISPKSRINYLQTNINDRPDLFYKDKKYGLRPSSTFGGPRYYGGTSDHLAIYADFYLE